MFCEFSRGLFLAVFVISGAVAAAPARAEETPAWTHQLTYTADVTGALQGGVERAGRVLDNIDLLIDGDLDKAFGWKGTRVHAYVLNNSGGHPNDLVGSLQGVDNIEVAQPRLRLYEAWAEHDFGAVSALAGLYNLNSEFYTTETSGLLIAPPFGIGSELASTGPNGPSIFPLTALAVRLKAGADKGLYGEAAVLSAHAGTIGQTDQLQLGMDRGALIIGEAGWRGTGRIAVGAWGYSEPQDDIRDTVGDGSPARSPSHGVYLLAEGPLHTAANGAALKGFLRAGASDGDTSPYIGGWQAGVRLEQFVPGRPKAQVSVGVQQGLLSRKQRANGADEGREIGPDESGIELAYADTVGRVTIHPDLQFIRHPEGDQRRGAAVVGALRLIIDLN